jgi:hypothetical protein
MSLLELRPSEIGKTWVVNDWIHVQTMHGWIAIYPGFEHDKDSVVPNLPDPIAPIVHDFGYRHHVDAEGRILTRKQWDQIYAELSGRSQSRIRRVSKWWRYVGLRLFGRFAWTQARPIPYAWAWHYEQTQGRA